MEASGGGKLPQTPIVTCRMLRSPSHESVTTDLSLFSVSSLASELVPGRMRLVAFKTCNEGHLSVRGPSPNPDSKSISSRPPDIPEVLWFEEENDLIKSCAVLSSALGFQKSFSTSDITNLPSPEETPLLPLRCAVSEIALNALQRSGYIIDHPRLEHASRSCSTWVAVGDVASTSQLPSPHGGHVPGPASTAAAAGHHPPQPPPTFTAADLVRSVNKKVRQNYIRRRLMTTYKALERLSQSEFNLDRLEVQAASETERICATHLTVPGQQSQSSTTTTTSPNPGAVRVTKPRNLGSKDLPITLRDVERDRGKPLSKYERNMMIFNWLHTLDDSDFEGVA